jgi:hypothetical protein
MLKKKDQQALEKLLSLPLPKLEAKLAKDFQKTYPIADLLRVGSSSLVLLQDDSIHLINPGSGGIEDVIEVLYLVRSRKTPLTCIFITHSTPASLENLRLFDHLAKLAPDSFCFKVLAHKNNEKLTQDHEFYALVQDEEFVKFNGRRYLLLQTPGHSLARDQMTVFEMGHSILFLGTLLQPHGESYEYCTFVTPVSNHQDPEAVNASIEHLKSLPFEVSVTEEGDFLDRSRTFRWMDITRQIFERTSYFCRKVLWENDSGDLRQNARNVLWSLAMERNMNLEQLASRLDGEPGTSDFDRYDLPSISHYLKKFGGIDSQP